MNINVQVICEGCKKCQKLEIETIDMWGNDKIYDKIFACKHLEECQNAVELWRKEEANARK